MGTQRLILFITATIVAVFILFVMFSVHRRGQDASIDAVQYRAAKQDMLNVVEMIEQDFRNIGSFMYKDASCGNCFTGKHIQPVDVIIKDETVAVSEGTRRTFEFLAQPDSLSPPVPIRYVWEPNGETVTLSDGTVRSLHTLQRFVNGTLEGSTTRISQMNVTLKEGELMPPMSNKYDARIFSVSIRTISPLGKGDAIEETRFDASYRPAGIAITDRLN